MKFKEVFKKWELKSVKLNVKFADLEFSPNQADEDAAWEMYVELITRIATQNLIDDEGDEKTALNSIYTLFPITRDILKKYGRSCNEFSKIAIIVLNQIIRPFTTKWHKQQLDNQVNKISFRSELKDLQVALRCYTKLLAEIAKVEDISAINECCN